MCEQTLYGQSEVLEYSYRVACGREHGCLGGTSADTSGQGSLILGALRHLHRPQQFPPEDQGLSPP